MKISSKLWEKLTWGFRGSTLWRGILTFFLYSLFSFLSRLKIEKQKKEEIKTFKSSFICQNTWFVFRKQFRHFLSSPEFRVRCWDRRRWPLRRCRRKTREGRPLDDAAACLDVRVFLGEGFGNRGSGREGTRGRRDGVPGGERGSSCNRWSCCLKEFHWKEEEKSEMCFNKFQAWLG